MSDEPMDDAGIETQVDALEQERSALRREEAQAVEGRPDAVPAMAARLEEIRVELDRLYDLRQQRRGLREAGRDPNDASERDAGTVEDYLS